MIRRDVGDDFLLVPQHEHALGSGVLARHLGNLRPETIEGIAHHDAGWPLHDDEPILNPTGLPLHVFEVPVPIAIRVWGASVERAAALGPYQGLLVSLHVLNLSALFQTRQAPGNWSRPDFFEMNKFQHRQVEVQEQLRAQLGLGNDVPRHLGLAALGASAGDDQLLCDFRLLTAMDRVSLALCCGQPLFPTMDDVHARPGEPPTRITTHMPNDATMTLTPWPFDRDEIRFTVPARRVRKQPFEDVTQFRQAYAEATVESLELRVARP